MLATLLRRGLLAAAACAALGAGAVSAQTGVLGLVLDETRVREGSLTAEVVVRTTSARALASGSFAIGLRDKDGLPGGAFTALTGIEVLSGAGDAVADATFDPVTQRTEVSFSSASGTVNQTFGPMVILHYQLEPSLVEDRRFILRLDSDSIALAAANGQPVFFFTEKGRLRIDRADADVDIEAEGGHAVPGSTVVFGARTEVLGEIVSGTVEFLFDPAWTNGAASASIHPAYGAAVVDSVTQPQPGRLLVTFHATGGDLNTLVPGPFLAIAIPSRADVPLGSRYPVILGPGTVVIDGNGQAIGVEATDPELIRFVRPRLRFLSGFDDGTVDDFGDDNPT
ncbi:MAG: hypothetical protein F9K18_06070 [Thermoanaerobaculia bacterium]|nr:MAG: hypothetical protein F9K18_06070 [Thermoanaerobaculia bacterium]